MRLMELVLGGRQAARSRTGPIDDLLADHVRAQTWLLETRGLRAARNIVECLDEA